MEQKPAPMRARLLSRLLRPTAPPVALGLASAAFFIVAESLVVVLLPRRVFQHAAGEAPPDEYWAGAPRAVPRPRHTDRTGSRASCAVLR